MVSTVLYRWIFVLFCCYTPDNDVISPSPNMGRHIGNAPDWVYSQSKVHMESTLLTWRRLGSANMRLSVVHLLKMRSKRCLRHHRYNHVHQRPIPSLCNTILLRSVRHSQLSNNFFRFT